MPALDRFTWVPSLTPTPRHELPKHMVCPNCENTWKGYVIHTTNCPTPNWVYNSLTDVR